MNPALEIARRCADRTTLDQAVKSAAQQSQYAEYQQWQPISLAQGHTGIALLCAEMDQQRPDEGWDRAGHEHLQTALAGAAPHDVSLISGLAGAGLAAIRLSGGRERYRRLLAQIDSTLTAPVRATVHRLQAGPGTAAHDLDLVSGLTGLAAYLLTRAQTEPNCPDARASLDLALGTLARLLADRSDPRAWHTPAQRSAGPLLESYPNGHHNCGLAHGVPGPLAILSLAWTAGIQVPRAREALQAAASWLVAHHSGTPEAPDWPDAVPLGSSTATQRCGPGRAAWCYGAPGVARSLYLASVACDETLWRETALRTIRAVANRPVADWQLITPGFCHGTAGLAQILARFAADTANPQITAAARVAREELTLGFEADSVLGVRAVEPGQVRVDHPGLLDGAPGVALALLGVPATADPAWDRAFLLA
ncbi:lanthionine synthetase C family protein [Kineosporia babensis]|uniref:Lanthionine synthetase C family protein n=1 Tax=Kineosporia babensis TaxID=499548 RepID=A0A9X1NKV5_9ACTN|nr:lanthionine synthetase C family protein [Kineosporia babensis]MCD5315950.1 lanthionine synthetase C family protein [Kineosporia babensis]